MKNIEKLSSALDNLTKEYSESQNEVVGDAIIAIHEFIIDNTPIKKGALSVWEFVSKDKLRPAMMNVFHDNGAKAAVATDAHVLFINPSEYIDSTEKPDDCEQKFDYDGYTGLIRDKYGKPVKDGRYPVWRNVFPKETMTFDVREDLQKVRDIAKSSCKLAGRSGFQICLNAELDIWIAGAFVDVVIRAGLDGWMCCTELPNRRALTKEWEDGRKMLIMPVIVDPDESERTSENGYDSENLVVFL